jgi:hypothetical protein
MVQVPIDHVFETPDGGIAKQTTEPGSPNITARDVLIVAATNELPEDAQPGTSGQSLITQKLARFSIWQKLKSEEQKLVHFTAEEVVLLKDRIAKIFGVVIAAPMFHLLDGKKADGTPKPVQVVDPPSEKK